MLFFFVLLAFITLGLWHSVKPLPQGLNRQSDSIRVAADRVEFLADLTYRSEAGQPLQQQQIFQTLFELIDRAQHYILIDFFLLNDQSRQQNTENEALAAKLVEHIVAAKKMRPQLTIDVLTDPINNAYAAAPAKELRDLEAAGIRVIVTNLTSLRDSNPLYSTLWRLLLRWIPDRGRLLPHPFDKDAEKVSLASGLSLLNFKANHRKVALIDHQGTLTTLVSSANPHGGSSRHSNVALLVSDNSLAEQLYRSEQAVARLSGAELQPLPQLGNTKQSEDADKLEITLLTEGAIAAALMEQIGSTEQGDSIRMAMFYLAERSTIDALVAASLRGVEIEIILDPNRDAFGYKKNGVPNLPVAAELIARSNDNIRVRWYLTQGEQFHSKMVLIERQEGRAQLLAGSANLTRRNIGNLNLETNLLISGKSTTRPLTDASDYFERIWNNRGGQFTSENDELADNSTLKVLQYRLQEMTGIGTF
jgi:phosphatidylserine/phosphatidylglycerophosphate/cardiolipin synthase-like enzyme